MTDEVRRTPPPYPTIIVKSMEAADVIEGLEQRVETLEAAGAALYAARHQWAAEYEDAYCVPRDLVDAFAPSTSVRER